MLRKPVRYQVIDILVEQDIHFLIPCMFIMYWGRTTWYDPYSFYKINEFYGFI